MSNPLGSSGELVKRLETIVLDLPEPTGNLEVVDPTGRKRELRQIAGISAGGTLPLKPGVFSFGTQSSGSGRLADGSPDRAEFALVVDKEMNVSIRPTSSESELPEISVEGEPLSNSVSLNHQVIDAGSARFVVGSPRPTSVRSRARHAGLAGNELSRNAKILPPWVASCVPELLDDTELTDNVEISLDLVNAERAGEIDELVQARRKSHLLPDEIVHRAFVGSTLIWDRSPSHSLFGTSVVGLGDIPAIVDPADNHNDSDGIEVVSVGFASADSGEKQLLGTAYGVPLSVDLTLGPVAVVGPAWLRSSIIRQILLTLAVASGPNDVRLRSFPACSDYEFARSLPHFSSTEATRALAVVDEDASAISLSTDDSEESQDWVIQGVDRIESLPSPPATIVTAERIDELTLAVGRDVERVDDLTPVGIARSLAEEIALSLAEHGFGSGEDRV